MTKNYPRVLLVLLCAVTAVTLVATTVPTALAATSGDFTFDIANGEVTITGYTGAGGAVAIPATISGYPVVAIGGSAFYECTELTSVTIPDGVRSISEIGAYTGYNIPSGAFYGCTSLTSVAIPASVTDISDRAFLGCSALASITIPGGVTRIGVGAFQGCSRLAEIVIPDSVTDLGSLAFADCTGLKDISLPTKLESLGGNVFSGCTGLTSVTIHQGADSSTDFGTFRGCTGLKSVNVDRGVASLGGGDFAGCTQLAVATIPDSVTSIGDGTFSGCKDLTIYGLNESFSREYAVNNDISFVAFEEYLFSISDGGATIIDYLGDGSSVAIPSAFAGYPVTAIGTGAFYGIGSLTEVTIPSSVTSIAVDVWTYPTENSMDRTSMWAFSTCEALTSIIVDNANPTYSSVDGVLYSKDQSLLIKCPDGKSGDFTVPSTVKTIGSYALNNCNRITSVVIPDGVTVIEDGAFSHCDRLVSVTIPVSVTSIGRSAFEYCGSLKDATIPSSVTSIGKDVFEGCSALNAAGTSSPRGSTFGIVAVAVVAMLVLIALAVLFAIKRRSALLPAAASSSGEAEHNDAG